MAYFGALLALQIQADWAALADPRPDLDTALALVASGYILLLMATYWRKPPPLAERRDLVTLLTTLVAIDAFGVIARQPVTQPTAGGAAGALILLGTLLAIWSALNLRQAFSVLPQARTLVSAGPYAYLRHPMYAGGLLITLGELWLRWSPLTVLVCVVAVAAQIARMHIEERLLSEHVPGYCTYRARTSALIPGIY